MQPEQIRDLEDQLDTIGRILWDAEIIGRKAGTLPDHALDHIRRAQRHADQAANHLTAALAVITAGNCKICAPAAPAQPRVVMTSGPIPYGGETYDTPPTGAVRVRFH